MPKGIVRTNLNNLWAVRWGWQLVVPIWCTKLKTLLKSVMSFHHLIRELDDEDISKEEKWGSQKWLVLIVLIWSLLCVILYLCVYVQYKLYTLYFIQSFGGRCAFSYGCLYIMIYIEHLTCFKLSDQIVKAYDFFLIKSNNWNYEIKDHQNLSICFILV